MRRILLALAAAALLLIGPIASARAAPDLPTVTSWPLVGVPEVVRGFDPPATPWGAGHRGVDLAGQIGDPVLSAAAGTVTYAGLLAGRGVIVVNHGIVRTTYEPVTATVRVGDRVSAGDQIGTLDAGHCADQPCLHWGLKQGGTYLNPLLLAPNGPAGGSYRLVSAADRAVVERRAEDRRQLQQRLATVVGAGDGSPPG